MMSSKKVILYVDDDADDREFLLDAINKADPEVKVVMAENGLEALHYLDRVKDSEQILPSLIVLDINMPYLDGWETFSRLQKDAALQAVPVIIFSSSEKPDDKAMFNREGIEFFTKPSDISHFRSIVTHFVQVCC
ncbi:MAG TPA: response regulator [Flavisolibacter sp.]|jgi:CheY-like chemotaxis protein